MWYQSGHNLFCAFTHVCNAGPANPQQSPSSPEPLPVASFSTCPISPISPISPMSACVDSFEAPWNKVRPTLRRAVDAGERPAPDDCRHLIRVIVDAMREHSLNPTRRECVVVAKAITQKYPNSFLDKKEEGLWVWMWVFQCYKSFQDQSRISRQHSFPSEEAQTHPER